MMVEFQYFKECPNAAATLENLKALIREGLFRESDLSIVEVPTLDSAEERGFQGSPTVLVDGVDVYTGRAPVGFRYTCRFFEIDGEKTGILTKGFLRSRYRKIRTK